MTANAARTTGTPASATSSAQSGGTLSSARSDQSAAGSAEGPGSASAGPGASVRTRISAGDGRAAAHEKGTAPERSHLEMAAEARRAGRPLVWRRWTSRRPSERPAATSW